MWDNFARGQCCSWLSRSQKKNKGTSGSALYFQEFSRSCGLQIKLEYRCVKGFLRRGEDLGAQGITISSHKWHRADTLRKQPTFHITTTVFAVKWCFKSKGRHYNTADARQPRSLLVEAHFQPVRTTTQIWVVMCHQCGISVLVSQTSFSKETTSGGVTKCKPFSLAILPGF